MDFVNNANDNAIESLNDNKDCTENDKTPGFQSSANKNKKIHDVLYGYIEITPLMSRIIDTPEFQRLRDIKQLGPVHFVFPSATHTRFEHSIGVSYLAQKMCESIVKNYSDCKNNDKPVLNDRDIELYRIAALIHDIGHGPYSHLYDDNIVKNGVHHEERGIMIFKQMVKRYNLSLTQEEEKTIINYVDPPKDCVNCWRYQIIANKFNGIDVDKLDYIQRDCYHLGLKYACDFSRIIEMVNVKQILDRNNDTNNNAIVLSWPEKIKYDIYSMFSTRYRLHKQIYEHHAVKSYEPYIVNILKKITSEFNIQDSKNNNESDLKKFLTLTDSTVHSQLYNLSKLEHYKKFNEFPINRFNKPKLIGEIIGNKKDEQNIMDDLNKFIEKSKEQINQIVINIGEGCSSSRTSSNESFSDIMLNKVFNIKFTATRSLIGFSSSENGINPLQNVYCYGKKNYSLTKEQYNKSSVGDDFCYPNNMNSSFIIPPREFQELICRVYLKIDYDSYEFNMMNVFGENKFDKYNENAFSDIVFLKELLVDGIKENFSKSFYK